MKIIKKIFLTLIIILILGILFFLYSVVFGHSNIISRENGKSIIVFGYDEENNRFQINESEKFELNGIDGTYILDNYIYSVNESNKVIKKKILKNDSIEVKVNNKDLDQFYFKLKDTILTEKDEYKLPKKIICISDIEGNFNGFSSFLIANKVIDKNYNWIFGNGHLVLNGDFVDRGDAVTQVLNLIYKIENQATEKGGKVHYILGNHEIMNTQGTWKDNDTKYLKINQILSKNENLKEATKFIYSQKTEIGKWLQSKNVIEKIGDYIFVHGGISPKILKYDLTINEINTIARKNYSNDLYNDPKKDKIANFVMGKEGLFWYRGFAVDYKYYDKIKEKDLDRVLKFYNCKKIIIGHTVENTIKKSYSGKVINIDVKHIFKKHTGKTCGLLIIENQEFVINDLGEIKKLN